MPIYSYACPHCLHSEERIVQFKDRDTQMCSKCELETNYKPSFKTGAVLGLPNGYSNLRSKCKDKKTIGGADTK